MKRMLTADWFSVLAQERGSSFSQRGRGEDRFTFGSPKEFNVAALHTSTPPFLEFRASDPSRQQEVELVATEAIRRVEDGSLGDIVWYSTTFPTLPLRLNSTSMLAGLFQLLSSQTRVSGWRRLGPFVLLEFVEEADPKNAEIFAPRTTVHAHLAAVGPCAGDFTSAQVHSLTELIAATSSFSLGRPVEMHPIAFPSKNQDIVRLNQLRCSPEVLTLARKHVSLDIISGRAEPGGIACFNRLRAALLTFDAAMRQERDAIACILFVVAAECLTTPNTPWKDTKLTKRFIEFYDTLMPDEIDGLVAHPNFESAFGFSRGRRGKRALRKEFLNRVYEFRSGQLHEGLKPSSGGPLLSTSWGEDLKRALFLDFAEAAILKYLQSPRSSLIGHPALDPIGSSTFHAPGRVSTGLTK